MREKLITFYRSLKLKNKLTIYGSLEDKISYYHLAAFVILLPFDRFYSELVLISFLVHVAIHITPDKLKRAFSIETLVSSSVFFISVVGVIYSQDRSEGLQDLQKSLGIILFPILLACCGLDLKKYATNLLLIFCFTCVLTVAYLYLDALHIIVYNKLPLSTLFTGAFINHNFSEPIGLHATYFAMYCGVSESILFYLFLVETRKSNRFMYLLALCVLLAGLLQLASRAVLISGVVVALSFPFLLSKRAGKTHVFAIVAGVLMIAGILIVNISSFRMRYVAQLKEDLTQQSINNEVLEPRILRWEYIVGEIKRAPLIGYGTGSENKVLNRMYFDNKLYNSYLHDLNSHNQYLGFLVETGIWGLLLFLCTLIIGLIAAVRQKNLFFLSFLIIVSIVSFSENILETNKGIFFYSFFFSLFILSGKPFEEVFRFKRRSRPNLN